MTDETLGERIKRLREAQRWTQEMLADRLGVSTKTVGNWERGRNDPRSSVGALRQVFGRAFDAGAQFEDAATDPVEAALRASELIEWRQDAVLSVYKRNLHEQREERAG